MSTQTSVIARSLYGLPAVLRKSYWIVFSPDFANLARIPVDRIDLPETYTELSESGFISSSRGKQNTKVVHVTMIVTNDCNLRCKYCFADSGVDDKSTKRVLDLEIATAALHHAANVASGRKLSISFFGGEPTTQFGLIKKIVSITRQISAERGLPNPELSITTNGVFSALIFDYLIGNQFQVTLSADGPSEVQDFQRPTISGRSSHIVEQTIRQFVIAQHPIKVRATVTAISVHKMAEIVSWLADLGGSEIQFEPVSIAGRARSFCEQTSKPEVDDFIDNLKLAIERGCEVGIGVSHSSFMNLTNTPFSFCDGNFTNRFAVTYEGEITRCVEVQDHCHPAANLFLLGKYDKPSGKFIMQDNQRQFYCGDQVVKLRSGDGNDCSACFATRICGGGCPVRNFHVNKSPLVVDEYRCKITREIIPYIYGLIDEASETP